MCVTVGLEIMAHSSLSCAMAGCLDADVVSNQTDDAVVAGPTLVSGRRGYVDGRSGQLDGIIYAEVLQLDQLTFRHPDFDTAMQMLTCQLCMDGCMPALKKKIYTPLHVLQMYEVWGKKTKQKNPTRSGFDLVHCDERPLSPQELQDK